MNNCLFDQTNNKEIDMMKCRMLDEMKDDKKIDYEKCAKTPCEFIIKDGVLTNVKYLINKTELIIPEGAVKILDNIFDETDTDSLERIVFSSTLVDIGEKNFVNIDNLKEVVVNEHFVFEDNCLYTKDYKKLCFCLKEVEKDVKVKEGCEYICCYAFSRCDVVKRIILPQSVKKIGEWAFGYCGNLKEIVMPKYIDKIEEYAFADSREIEQINLPENLTKIPIHLLYLCNIKRLKIPDSAKTVEKIDGISLVGNPLIRLVLSKENKELEEYFLKHGLIFEYENAIKYEHQQAKELCIKLGEEFRAMFAEWYFKDGHGVEEYYPKLQHIFNDILMIKIKGQGYLFDNQIRQWFFTNGQEIPYQEKAVEFQRYYDRFCSYLLAWKSCVYTVIIDDDKF